MPARSAPQCSVESLEVDAATGLPAELLVSLDMGNTGSMEEVDLFVSELRLQVTVRRKYYHHLHLPHPVLADKGKAKFHRASHTLRVILEVDQQRALNELSMSAASKPDEKKVEVTPTSSEAAPTPAPELCVGMRVCLCGLQRCPELNGQVGTLVEFDKQDERWVVQMEALGLSTYARPEHLQPSALPGPEPAPAGPELRAEEAAGRVARPWGQLQAAEREERLAALAAALRRHAGLARRLQACADWQQRFHAGATSGGLEEWKLVVAGPIRPEECDAAHEILSTLCSHVSDVIFHTGVVEEAQCPLLAGAVRCAYSRRRGPACAGGVYDALEQLGRQDMVLAYIDTQAARALLSRADLSEVDLTPLANFQAGPWKALSPAARLEVLEGAERRMGALAGGCGNAAVADLALEDFREDWRCGEEDETFEGLRLHGHLPTAQLGSFAELLRFLFQNVTDLSVEVAVYPRGGGPDYVAACDGAKASCGSCGQPLRPESAWYLLVHTAGTATPPWVCSRCENSGVAQGSLLYELLPHQRRRGLGGLLRDCRWQPECVRRPLAGSVNAAASHVGMKCSRCGTPWSTGPVWKCAHRLDYQECDACHQKHSGSRTHEPSHIFIKVSTFGGGLPHMFPLASSSRERRWRESRGVDLLVAPDHHAVARWTAWMRRYFASSPSPRASLVLAPAPVQEVLSEAAPRVLWVRDFLTPAECDHLIRLGMATLEPGASLGAGEHASSMLPADAKDADAIVAAIEQRIGALVAIPPHADEDELNLVFRPEPRSEEAHAGAEALVNLHLDARLGRPYSAATVLVYLNDVECGGGTVFPCVGQGEDVKAAFDRAFRQGKDFLEPATPGCCAEDRRLLGMAEEMARGQSLSGLVTKPTRGCAVAFWTLNPSGPPGQPWSRWAREPLAWHGGVRVFPGGRGKWLLQKFKELPLQMRSCGA